MASPLAPTPTLPAAAAPGDADLAGLPLAAWARAVRPSTIQAMLVHMARPGVISFALGLPAPELFPLDDYAAAAARLLADPGVLQYRAPHVPLKEQIVALMRARGVRCTPAQVFITGGAQQALSLLARLFLEPGGSVLC
jgi:2-aminoadipate transaminase